MFCESCVNQWTTRFNGWNIEWEGVIKKIKEKIEV